MNASHASISTPEKYSDPLSQRNYWRSFQKNNDGNYEFYAGLYPKSLHSKKYIDVLSLPRTSPLKGEPYPINSNFTAILNDPSQGSHEISSRLVTTVNEEELALNKIESFCSANEFKITAAFIFIIFFCFSFLLTQSVIPSSLAAALFSGSFIIGSFIRR